MNLDNYTAGGDGAPATAAQVVTTDDAADPGDNLDDGEHDIKR